MIIYGIYYASIATDNERDGLANITGATLCSVFNVNKPFKPQ